MSLFRDLGERVERFKREVTDAAEGEAALVCRDCGEVLYTDADACRACGSENLEVVKNDEGTDTADDRNEGDGE